LVWKTYSWKLFYWALMLYFYHWPQFYFKFNTNSTFQKKKKITQKSHETIPLNKCGLIHVLESCFLTSSAYTALCGSVVTYRENIKVGQKFPIFQKIDPLLHEDKCHCKVGQKIQGKNVTDFGRNYCGESKCHTMTNFLNFLGWNVTMLGGLTIRPLWDGMSRW
jgi:uncharacterized UBP type Zn finger protein